MQPTTAVRPLKPRVSGRTVAAIVVATVLFAVIIGSLAWALRSPTFVPEVELVNETPYSVNVDVSGEEGRIGLGTVPAGGSLALTDVLDRGDTWVFEFSYAGVDAGEIAVARAALEDAEWTIEVPGDVGDLLTREGYGPSAE